MSRELEQARRDLSSLTDRVEDVRGELERANAARDEALIQASEAAERAHREAQDRDDARNGWEAATADVEHAEDERDAAGERAQAAERRAVEAECDRDQARADRDASMAMVEERDDQARTVRELRAEVATLQEDRQRLAKRWGEARRQQVTLPPVLSELTAGVLAKRLARLRDRNRLLTHRLREARRELARVAEQHGPFYVHADGCGYEGEAPEWKPCRLTCGGKWVG